MTLRGGVYDTVVVANELEYEVKEILDSKLVRGKLQYYVDWKGYSPQDRTWEPAAHLDNSPDLVATFHARYPLRPSPGDTAASLRPRRS